MKQEANEQRQVISQAGELTAKAFVARGSVLIAKARAQQPFELCILGIEMIVDGAEFGRCQQKTAALKGFESDVLRVQLSVADAGLLMVEQILDANMFGTAPFVAVADADVG